MDETSRIAEALVTLIQRLQSEEEQQPSRHATALAKLADIFNKNTCNIPRVNKPTHQTSTQPMAPEIINTAPPVHQRNKRANTPGMILPCSRVITPPNSRVTIPPTQPTEERSHTPDWNESPRVKRTRKRVRTAPKEKRKIKTHSDIHEPVQATLLSKFQKSRLILQEALTEFTATVWGTSPENFIPQSMRRDEHKINTTIKLEHFCTPFVHPVSGETISKY